MGVNGLWQVLQPCARPTNLATLNRKRLAVDASIWIYQFLKAVRDKEGNALRNSHVVGFFRRICKLLWFGIRPVFVFDGGAPALKRATLQGRRRRREGRREDAVRTAGKLLAVQIQRIAEEEEERRRRRKGKQREEGHGENEIEDVTAGGLDGVAPGEVIPSAENIVYEEEAHMSRQERQKNRKFFRQDAYHLPELENGIEGMGRPEDPRIMSIDELEEYARHFHAGEDINLYDFSKIDFDGEFFKSLPPADRYNILNAARIRSRLRMGLSKEQLDGMFPDRMAFSRFQIERVRERNKLTQRLMYEMGMAGTDLTIGVNNARIAGEKDREYILVKNDGAEGGWALGVVSRDKDRGKMHKPIDVDALQVQYRDEEHDDDEWEDDEDFEDVPVEGLNRLPKLKAGTAAYEAAEDIGAARRRFYEARRATGSEEDTNQDDDSIFVDNGDQLLDELFESEEQDNDDALLADEDEDLNRAIAMSLQSQHGIGASGEQREEEELQEAEEEEEEEEAFEDVPMPQWTQKAVDAPKPITSTSGKMVAHIVNNRANAAVPRRRESDASSDSDVDIGAALAAARKKKAAAPVSKPAQPAAPIRPNMKNPFDGPLPFEKLDWRTSIFEKKPATAAETGELEPASSDEEEQEGGFEKQAEDAPRPLPPWMVDNTDIRESVQKQRVFENQINAEDREMAEEEERLRRKYQEHQVVEIESSSEDEDDDIELLDVLPPSPPRLKENAVLPASDNHKSPDTGLQVTINEEAQLDQEVATTAIHDKPQEQTPPTAAVEAVGSSADYGAGEPPRSPSPEMEFEDVELPDKPAEVEQDFEELPDVPLPTADTQQEGALDNDDALFADGGDLDEFSDPEEEELLAQMAEEAEEHARFASTLNNKSERENQESYERELKALRSQQKKDRRDADEVTQIMVTECQALLRLFGIPYITAPMEAEAQCAELVALGLVDGIVTDDSDIFLFGGTRVYKNMFNSNKFVECYLSTDLEKELSLSRAELIAAAQLLGSDYAEGLPGVGPVTAVEILSEFPGPEGLAQFREWWQDVQVRGRPKEADASSPFRRKFRKAQATKLFLPTGFPSPAVAEAYLHPEVDRSTEPFQWGVPDLEGLRQFLMATIGWGQERTDEVLVPVIRDMNRREAEGTQSNITRFFSGAVGAGAREAFAPRHRPAKASRRMAEAVGRLRAKTGTATASNGAATDGPEGGSGSGSTLDGGRAPAGRKRKARNAAAAGEGADGDGDGGDDDDYDDDEAGEDGQGQGQDRQDGAPARARRGRGRGGGRRGAGKKARAAA